MELQQHKAEIITYLHQRESTLDLPGICDLLVWAAALSEQNIVLAKRVRYVEAPLRTVTTECVSLCAGHYLRTIAYARMNRTTGECGGWTSQRRKEQEVASIVALRALRDASERAGIGEPR